jgi:nucleoside-specific outer membrane channel protein Tsx
MVVGTVDLYAASSRAFVGHHDALADVFGAWAAGAVVNADLSFAPRKDAQAAPQHVHEEQVIDMATGIVAAELGVDVDTAWVHLHDASVRAGCTLLHLASEVVHAHERQDREGP